MWRGGARARRGRTTAGARGRLGPGAAALAGGAEPRRGGRGARAGEPRREMAAARWPPASPCARLRGAAAAAALCCLQAALGGPAVECALAGRLLVKRKPLGWCVTRRLFTNPGALASSFQSAVDSRRWRLTNWLGS